MSFRFLSVGWLLMFFGVCKGLGGLGRGFRGWRGGGFFSRSFFTFCFVLVGESRLRDSRVGVVLRRLRSFGFRGGRRGFRYVSGAFYVRRDGGIAVRGAFVARVRLDVV